MDERPVEATMKAEEKRAARRKRNLFEASEEDYRERLEQIKLQKKYNRKKLKAVERCLERDGSVAVSKENISSVSEAVSDEIVDERG